MFTVFNNFSLDEWFHKRGLGFIRDSVVCSAKHQFSSAKDCYESPYYKCGPKCFLVILKVCLYLLKIL